ncbi:MAG: hypothetical protein H7276_12845 [Caulobacter sp.]|nr:hypothetical protein [Vitreoscilla sp.]
MGEFRHQGPTGGAHPPGQAKLPGSTGKHKASESGGTPGSVGKHDAASKAAPPPPPQKSLVCACNRDLTHDEMVSVFPKATEANCVAFLPMLNDSFKTYGITTCLRKAHFLAQVGPETGDLKWMKEIGAHHGGYEGRGLLQLTSEPNYKAYGKAVTHDFLGEHAKEVEEPKWAVDSATWFWDKYRDLSPWADKNDLRFICCRINGGFNGYDDRHDRLAIAFDWLLVHTCKTVNIGDATYIPFEKSEVHDWRIFAFAWGLWNDASANRKGIAKPDANERKAGYQRYLDLQAAEDLKTLSKLKAEAAAKAAKAAKAAAKAHHGAAPESPATPASDPKLPDPDLAYGYTRTKAIAKATEGVK